MEDMYRPMSVVTTKDRRAGRSDLLFTIGRFSSRGGLSARDGVYPERSRGAPRSRRRKAPDAATLLIGLMSCVGVCGVEICATLTGGKFKGHSTFRCLPSIWSGLFQTSSIPQLLPP